MSFLLSSCVSYSVTEEEIQDYLDSRASFERTVGIKGLAYANVKFSDIKVGIGRVSNDRVNLDAKSQAKIMISGQPQQEVMIDVSFSAIPYYDKDEGAIFLNDLEVESLELQPDELTNFAGKQLLTPIVEMIGQLILTNPVYRLDEDDFEQSALKTAKPELLIKNHSLVVQI
ncbi:DUF1439 domain-containing protein [Photobacterium sp. SDRW27]|uniref:DUF1439 domain-containing protein n=1 Tax=Photobacterium obscurum TaxID=2829490 RepID=UPI002242ED51|nr:DUF1439 domain-containing protein [Photobacterium obscurum]MCW8329390.1 DUF1439 domain-containing protein [Photobacterium obscurum]